MCDFFLLSRHPDSFIKVTKFENLPSSNFSEENFRCNDTMLAFKTDKPVLPHVTLGKLISPRFSFLST